MPVTIKKSQLKYKNPDTGSYVGIDGFAERTTAEMVQDITTSGQARLNAINTAGATQLNTINTRATEVQASLPTSGEMEDMVAVPFVQAKAYPVNKHVIQAVNGVNKLFILPKGHEANVAWEDTEKQGPYNLGDEITDLKAALNNEIFGSNALDGYGANPIDCILGTAAYWAQSGVGTHLAIPVKAGDNVYIKGNGVNTCYFGVLRSYQSPTNTTLIDYSTDSAFDHRIALGKNNSYTYTMPADAKYLCINNALSETIFAPEEIKVNGLNMLIGIRQSIKEEIKANTFLINAEQCMPISSNYDFNDITTPGNYTVASVAIARTILNIPEFDGAKLPGRLLVISTQAPTSCTQIYIAGAADRVAWRVFANNAWSDHWAYAATTRYAEEKIKANAKGLSLGMATLLDSQSDLNDVVTPGNYYIDTFAKAQTISNLPTFNGTKYQGRLTVSTVQSSTAIMQEYTEGNTGKSAYRFVAGSTFSEWKYDVISTDLTTDLSLKIENSTSISNGEDLDDYNIPGNYYIWSAAAAGTIENVPDFAGVKLGGRLTVMHINSATSFIQIYVPTASTTYAIRRYGVGGWGNWFRFSTLEDFEKLSNSIQLNDEYIALNRKGIGNMLNIIQSKLDYDIAFANSPAPINLKNYLGDIFNVHPKVLYFENGFGGHKYWMAYTPCPYYYQPTDLVEDPSIAYSDDGYSWENIPDTPLARSQGTPGHYYSDPHLVFRADTGTLECWYRKVGEIANSTRSETLYRRTTQDGFSWTAQEEMLYNDGTTEGVRYSKWLSPCIIWDGTKYLMWTIRNTDAIDYYESSGANAKTLSLIRSWMCKPRGSADIRFNEGSTNLYPWHFDVIIDNGLYIMCINARNHIEAEGLKSSVFIITSTDNITYGEAPLHQATMVISSNVDSWDRYQYRPSIVKVGSKYRIYYSGLSGGTETIYNYARYGIGITESDQLMTGYIGKMV